MVLGTEEWRSDCPAAWDIKEEGGWGGKGRKDGGAEDESQKKGLALSSQEGRWTQSAQASWRVFW